MTIQVNATSMVFSVFTFSAFAIKRAGKVFEKNGETMAKQWEENLLLFTTDSQINVTLSFLDYISFVIAQFKYIQVTCCCFPCFHVVKLASCLGWPIKSIKAHIFVFF